MGLIQEFRQFALKGNMIDMAVGIVIGGAFGTVIQSLVKDVITPPLGLLTEQVDFENMGPVLRSARAADPLTGTPAIDEVRINLGAFLNAAISFLVIATAVFVVIRIMNRVRQQFEASEETPSPTTKTCPFCKLEIPIAATKCGHCTSGLAA